MPRLFIQFLFIVVMSLFVDCDFPRKVTEIERYLSPDLEREIILQRSQSSDVRYITLVTKTKNKTLELQTPLYFEKDWDGNIASDFEKNFKARRWINNRVFFVGWNDDFESSKNEILIQNSSGKMIDQIEIDTDGTYIIYELQRNEIIKIPIRWQKRESFMKCWISATVDFSDGSKILPGSSEFYFTDPESNETGCGNGKIIVMNDEIK